MNPFNNFKSMNIDELAKWLDEYCYHDNAPWMLWFDKNYCQKCEGIPMNEWSCWEYSYCEVNKKCKFFPEMEKAPNCEEIVRLWLESEAENG